MLPSFTIDRPRGCVLSLLTAVLLAAALTLAPPAQAADGPELVPNAGLELEDGNEPLFWSSSFWPAEAPWTHTFEYLKTGGHLSDHSVRVTISGYDGTGDGKWVAEPAGQGVEVQQPGSYYTYSDWYRSSADTSVSVWYRLKDDPADSTGHWVNLVNAIPPSAEWTRFTTGFTMPTGATHAYFAHFLAGNGYLQTDDYSMRATSAPAGFARPMISMTFDNGSHGTYERAIPAMDARGLTSTQYIPTEGLRPNDGWMMTDEQIRTVAKKHEIGSHSVTHPHLPAIPAAQLEDELVSSRSLLENDILHQPGSVTSFAYPYGEYSNPVIAALKTYGYTSGRAVDEGYNGPAEVADPYKLKVQNVKPTTTVAEFKGWVDNAVAGKYWLIVVYHEVLPDSPRPPLCSVEDADPCEDLYDTYQSTFGGMMDYLVERRQEVDVVTVSQGLRVATNGVPTGTAAITPATPATDAVVTAVPAFTDPDGDELDYSYQWLRAGAAIPGATLATLDLSKAGHGDRGDEIGVRVTATDGHGGSSFVDATVTIRNSAPSAGSVNIAPTVPRAGTALTATPSGFADADGDALTYAYTWYRDGVAIAGQTAATLPGSEVGAGQTIRVDVRADDGHGAASQTAGATVHVTTASPADRTAPRIVVKSPKNARVYAQGRRLRIRFACADDSGAAAWKATLRRRGGSTRKVKPGKSIRLSRTGRYVLRVVAWDQAGNTAAKTIRFRVKAT